MSPDRSEGGHRFPDGKPEVEQPAWRRDFPIDLPQDAYVARRDYAKFLVLTSLAFVVGQFGIAFAGLKRVLVKPAALKIARVEDVPPGGALVFHFPGPHDPCLLVRDEDGSFLAYGQKCTHLSCAVVPHVDKDRIGCPCHEGAFDLATGRPLAGPPRRPLPLVKLEVRDGAVYALGVEERTV
jgi:Rieske Fe-S protein